jgi:hypothetical protein
MEPTVSRKGPAARFAQVSFSREASAFSSDAVQAGLGQFLALYNSQSGRFDPRHSLAEWESHWDVTAVAKHDLKFQEAGRASEFCWLCASTLVLTWFCLAKARFSATSYPV